MSTLGWKLNRLRTMGFKEISWRCRNAVVHWLERRLPTREAMPPARRVFGRPWFEASPRVPCPELYRLAADSILSGHFNLFAMRDVPLGFPPQWNRDAKTGTVAPLVYGKLLEYRDERIVGDVKYLWELNRHYELVTLAQAFHLSADMRYAQACRTMLESWWEQCPYPLGQAWSSSLENAIRLLNWAVAWHLLGGASSAVFPGADGEAFRQRWLDMIYLHCRFIAGNFSLHSSANNHLFGEYMGLFIGAVIWPCWTESETWQAWAREGLEQEALTQNAPDGVNREQGIWYHHEVADMMLLCLLFGRANGIEFSDAYRQRLEAMLDFIASVMDAAGNVPMIGDSDDATMVRFSQESDFHPYRSLLATGAVLFRRADFKTYACRFDDRNWWLLGQAGADAFDTLPIGVRRACRRVFPDGGYYIMGDDFGTPRELKLVADAGPLGYLSIAAHGHADALAFTLSAGGRPLLIDPGTYAYHTKGAWRGYFRGTAAHNTVLVDGRDQSEPGGNFMWLRKAEATCEEWSSDDEIDRMRASHDGYLRLADPVSHRRTITVRKRERIVEVADVLTCRDAHDIEFHWHFAEDCEVRIDGATVIATHDNVVLHMTMPGFDCLPEVVRGSDSPPLGWISRRFDERVRSSTVVWKERISGTTRRSTVISIAIGEISAPDAEPLLHFC